MDTEQKDKTRSPKKYNRLRGVHERRAYNDKEEGETKRALRLNQSGSGLDLGSRLRPVLIHTGPSDARSVLGIGKEKGASSIAVREEIRER